MKVTEFAKKISEQEGLKKGVDIAQISEVLKVVNGLLDGQLYSMIKNHGNTVSLGTTKTRSVAQKPIKKMSARALVNKNDKSTSNKKKS